jgi:hypothetical protein
MTKRMRGSSRGHRPGTRGPIRRPAGARPARPAAAPETPREPAATFVDSPPVTEPVATQVAETAAVASRPEARRVGTAAHPRTRAKPGSVLAARAANEYVYVAHDIRRIVLVALALFAAMLVAWLLIAVLKVVPLGLY